MRVVMFLKMGMEVQRMRYRERGIHGSCSGWILEVERYVGTVSWTGPTSM